MLNSIRDWTVGTRVTAGFVALGVIGSVLIGVFELGLYNLAHFHDVARLRSEEAAAVAEASATGAELYQIVADAQINQKFAETHTDWAAMKKTADDRMANVARFVRTEAQRTALAEAGAHYRALVTTFEEKMLPLLEREHRLSETTRGFDDTIDEAAAGLATNLHTLADALKQESAASAADFEASNRQTQLLAMLVAALGVMLAVATAWLVVRSLTGRLRRVLLSIDEGAQTILSMSGQVAGSASSLSQGATEQAASLEETSASMEQMAAMTRQNAAHTHEAADLVNAVHTRVNESQASLDEMVRSMAAITESSQKVSKIIKTIDEIAFQTNILALNAAVEAARAGDQGRGFAVVAGEVRALAQRSAGAAREIKGLIGASVDRVEAGCRLVGDAGTTIQEIVAQVGRVSQLINEISHASREQSSGIGQVGQAVSNLDQMTQQNAALVEESSAAAQAMHEQAQRLMQTMAVFQVGASTAAGQAMTAPPFTSTPTPQVAARAPVAPAPTVRAPAAPKAVVAPRTVASSKPAVSPDSDWETF